jgi:hypothetical protein
MKTFIIDNSEFFKFLIKYIICAGLLYYTVKTKKEKLLLKTLTGAFIVFSFIILANFLISLGHFFPSERPFYDIEFVDFIFVTLFVHIVFVTRKEKTPPQD